MDHFFINVNKEFQKARRISHLNVAPPVRSNRSSTLREIDILQWGISDTLIKRVLLTFDGKALWKAS